MTTTFGLVLVLASSSGSLITAGANVTVPVKAVATISYNDRGDNSFVSSSPESVIDVCCAEAEHCYSVVASLSMPNPVFVCGSKGQDHLADGLVVRWLLPKDDGFDVVDVIQLKECGKGLRLSDGQVISRP